MDEGPVFLKDVQGDCGVNDDVLKQSNGEEKGRGIEMEPGISQRTHPGMS